MAFLNTSKKKNIRSLHTTQKLTFSIKYFFRKLTKSAVTFTEEILNGKFHFLCSGIYQVLSLEIRVFSNICLSLYV